MGKELKIEHAIELINNAPIYCSSIVFGLMSYNEKTPDFLSVTKLYKDDICYAYKNKVYSWKNFSDSLKYQLLDTLEDAYVGICECM